MAGEPGNAAATPTGPLALLAEIARVLSASPELRVAADAALAGIEDARLADVWRVLIEAAAVPPAREAVDLVESAEDEDELRGYLGADGIRHPLV